MVACTPWYSLACRSVNPISASVITQSFWPCLHVSMSKFSSSYRDTSLIAHELVNELVNAQFVNATYNAKDLSSIPGSGRSTGEGIGYLLQYSWASLVAQLVKNLPAMQETQVRFLGWEDPLEKE